MTMPLCKLHPWSLAATGLSTSQRGVSKIEGRYMIAIAATRGTLEAFWWMVTACRCTTLLDAPRTKYRALLRAYAALHLRPCCTLLSVTVS